MYVEESTALVNQQRKERKRIIRIKRKNTRFDEQLRPQTRPCWYCSQKMGIIAHRKWEWRKDMKNGELLVI